MGRTEDGPNYTLSLRCAKCSSRRFYVRAAPDRHLGAVCVKCGVDIPLFCPDHGLMFDAQAIHDDLHRPRLRVIKGGHRRRDH